MPARDFCAILCVRILSASRPTNPGQYVRPFVYCKRKLCVFTSKDLSPVFLQNFIHMVEYFCRRTARKAVELGYAPEKARALSRFCCVVAAFTCGAVGATLDPSMKSLAGDGDEKPLCLPAKARTGGMDRPNRWHGPDFASACAPATHFLKILDRRPAP